MGRGRSNKLVEESDHGSKNVLMQNHRDDSFESEAEDGENSMKRALPSAANMDLSPMCTRCGEFPQSARKNVRKGLCCNRCPNHGPWCSSQVCPTESTGVHGEQPCTRQRGRPCKKRARVEAEDSDSSQLPIWPGRTNLEKGGGTFVEKNCHEEDSSTTTPPPSLEGPPLQNLRGNSSESNECASVPVVSEIERSFHEDESTTTPPSLKGQTSQNQTGNSSESNECASVPVASEIERGFHEDESTTPPPSLEGQTSQNLKEDSSESNECPSVPVASEIEGDFHEDESTTIPPPSMERQISQNLLENSSEANERASVPVVSEKARRLLAPKAAARPMGLWLRIAKRKEHMRSFQSKGKPLPAGRKSLATDTARSPHAEDQAAIASPETTLVTNDAVVSGADALVLSPNLALTEHPSKESIGVVNEVTSTQADDQVANNHVEQVILENVQSTPKASTRPTKKAAKENHVRPNENNKHHYIGHVAAPLKVAFPKRPALCPLRTPLASINRNPCGLRC